MNRLLLQPSLPLCILFEGEGLPDVATAPGWSSAKISTRYPTRGLIPSEISG